MYKIYKYLQAVTILLIAACSCITAQTLHIYNVETSQYPVMKASIRAKDATGKDIRNFDIHSDILIKDGGKSKDIKFYECPDSSTDVSLIIVLDASQSMLQYHIDNTDPNSLTYFDFAIEAIKEIIDVIPDNNSECCILSFNYNLVANPKLVHQFSDNKTTLKDSLKNIYPIGATDYNAAFLGNKTGDNGALYYASIAKYKPIIIFITDGSHDAPDYPPGNSVFHVGEVIDGANKTNATIYCFTLGVIGGSSRSDLNTLSSATGGFLADFPTQNNDFIILFNHIYDEPNLPPCSIIWETDCNGGDLELTLNSPKGGPTSTSFSYIIPDSIKAYIELFPKEIVFDNVKIGDIRDTVVSITARNFPIVINTIEYDNQSISILPPFQLPLSLLKDESVSLNLRLTISDTITTPIKFKFGTDACDSIIFTARINFDIDSSKDSGTINSVQDYPKTEISLYPNPAQDFTIIKMPDSDSKTEFEINIYDTYGAIVKKVTNPDIKNNQIDLNEFSSGVYFLKISTGNQYQMIPLLIIK
jgi:hypothetical protein